MAFVRLIENINPWTDWHLDENSLLKTFDNTLEAAEDSPQTVSLYRVLDASHIVEVCAGYFQNLNRAKVSKFGVVLVKDSDLDGLAITPKAVTESKLGIPEIDELHFDFTGRKSQFRLLIRKVVATVMTGEERIIVVPSVMISSRLQVFAGLHRGQIAQKARERCFKALGRTRSNSVSPRSMSTVTCLLKNGDASLSCDALLPNALECRTKSHVLRVIGRLPRLMDL